MGRSQRLDLNPVTGGEHLSRPEGSGRWVARSLKLVRPGADPGAQNKGGADRLQTQRLMPPVPGESGPAPVRDPQDQIGEMAGIPGQLGANALARPGQRRAPPRRRSVAQVLPWHELGAGGAGPPSRPWPGGASARLAKRAAGDSRDMPGSSAPGKVIPPCGPASISRPLSGRRNTGSRPMGRRQSRRMCSVSAMSMAGPAGSGRITRSSDAIGVVVGTGKGQAQTGIVQVPDRI